MTSPRKYDFKVGPCEIAGCEILEIEDPSGYAKDCTFTIKHGCCGRKAKLNWQGMLSRISRRTKLCWSCANRLALELREGNTKATLTLSTTSVAHPDFVPLPSWERPPSIKPGYWLWGR